MHQNRWRLYTVQREFFAAFADFSSYNKNFSHESLATMQATPFTCNRCCLLLKCQCLRIVHEFVQWQCITSSVEKVPDSTGSLSTEVLLSSDCYEIF